MDNRQPLVSAIKTGRAWNGFQNDIGIIVHAVEPIPENCGGDWFTPALCNTEPGRRGNGWYEVDKPINYPKCIKKLQKNINHGI